MKLFASVLVISAVAVTGAQADELITNGGFETGDLTGWTPFNAGSGQGDLFASNLNAGDSLPYSGFGAAGPSSGSWFACVDQGGGNSYSLSQNFTIAAGTTQVLMSFDMFHRDESGAAPLNSGNFDYGSGPVQWARVDILDSSGNVLATYADVANENWTNYSADITSLLTVGETYTFRYGHADNQFFFHSAIDNVSITTVPTPAAASLMGLAGVAAGRRRRR